MVNKGRHFQREMNEMKMKCILATTAPVCGALGTLRPLESVSGTEWNFSSPETNSFIRVVPVLGKLALAWPLL
jgi:hypothetical protein